MFKERIELIFCIFFCALWVPTISADFCAQAGKVCDDCNTVSYCVETNTGEWLKYHLYNCDSGYTCSDSLRDCTIQPNPKCDSDILGYRFICNQIGVFPDAFDCTKYHMCVKNRPNDLLPNPIPSTFTCGNGFSYDPFTVSCRNRFNGTCETRLPPCHKGYVGKIPKHPNMYYICFVDDVSGRYFPQMFVCPFDQEFNGEYCETVLDPPSGLDENGLCLDNGFFYDSASCKNYWYCSDTGLLPTQGECEEGRFFDGKLSLCVEFEC